ncbi:hypothetical protein K438DRAFT_670257 [Mycena galopus ATCC 62051]|nr:hypothetical protein K438DRAFT_670257 [Mycena galopus ATCC 62051]
MEGQEVLVETLLREVAMVGLARRLRLGSKMSFAFMQSAVSPFLVTLAHCLKLPGGGIGGAGGASGVREPNVLATGVNTGPAPQRIVDGMIGTYERSEVDAIGEATLKTRPNLLGGRGGVGGRGVALGGTGGVGGATKIPVLYVAFFKRIAGGIGGVGGYAVKRGGDGGVGEANIFPNLIFPIDKETRRRMPHTPLEKFEISENLRGPLKTHGFRTVGGLFEAYEQDLQPPDFKRGHISGLKGALRKVAAQHRI